MSLLEKVYPKYKIVSIIGMSKNAGKTYTLNHIIDEADQVGVRLGITSIGRDGERTDVVTETEKPTIFLPEQHMVATTRGLLELSDATVSIERITPYDTPLGEVIIGKIIYGGLVQISGPQTLKQTKDVSDQMLAYGAELAIIDGALDRKSSAAPEISEGTILATGAAYNRDMNRVIEETAHIAGLFLLPRLGESREIIADSIANKRYGILQEDGSVRGIDIETALGAGQLLADFIDEHTRYLIFPGALTTNIAKDLMMYSPFMKDIQVITTDATKVFIGAKEYKRLVKKGLNIALLHRSELAAITVNPFSPSGYQFNSQVFLEKLQESIPTVPVMDLMLGVS